LRTIAPNQRGYSPSARPSGRRPYVLPELVADALALLDRIGGPVHLVAHDWGAAVGWALTVRHAERIRSYTAVSVPHLGAFLAAMPRGQALRSWYMAMFNIPFLPEWLLRDRRRAQTFLGRTAMSEEAFADFWRDFGDGAALRGGLAWYRALPLTDSRKFAGKARVPTTYVWSTGDTGLGRRGAELCERFVDAPYRIEVLEGISHWIPDEAPEQLATAILERIGDVR
jgi:pimeloyl-ACP methyl ester carboxylesterase